MISSNGSVAIANAVYQAISVHGLIAAMELDLFTPLGDGALDASALAARLNLREDKLTPLLHSLVAAGFLQKDCGKFSNTEVAAKYLVRKSADYIGKVGGFYLTLLSICSKTAQSIRTGTPQAKLDFQSLSEEELSAYFRKQVHSSIQGGNDIANTIDLSSSRHLLDAGGGTGGVSIALCGKYPELKATIADLPKTASIAKKFVAEAGLSDRIDTIPCDICASPPHGQYDTVILRAVLQTLPREKCVQILKNISESIVPGGSILIFGSIAYNSHLGPASTLAYSLVFLNTYEEGGAYTESEYREMLLHTGFTDISVQFEILDDGMSLIRAVKI